MRISTATLAAVDVLSVLKEDSRNEILNNILNGALEDVDAKLKAVNPKLLKQYQEQKAVLEKELSSEDVGPPKKRGPKPKHHHID